MQKLSSDHDSPEVAADKIKEIKTMILLKSMVFGLFIVFVTLLIAFFLIKNQRLKKDNNSSKCSHYNSVMINDEIEKIEFQNNVITIITKLNKITNSQQIIRVDANCGYEINRINLINKQNDHKLKPCKLWKSRK